MVSTRSKTVKSSELYRDSSMNRNSSVANLTAPELYSIYGGKDDINDEINDTEIYTKLEDEIRHAPDSMRDVRTPVHHSSSHAAGSLLLGAAKIAFLGILGILFIELTRAVHESNPLLPDITKFTLLNGVEYLLEGATGESLKNFNVDTHDQKWIYASNALTGILLGLIQPFFDRLTGHSTKSSLQSSTVIRSATALIGISYGLKKTEWVSPLQASFSWSCLNPCLWMLLDGTFFGFISASTVSLISMLWTGLSFGSGLDSVEWSNIANLEFEGLDDLALVFWVGSFFFFAVILFGKIGRWLF